MAIMTATPDTRTEHSQGLGLSIVMAHLVYGTVLGLLYQWIPLT